MLRLAYESDIPRLLVLLKHLKHTGAWAAVVEEATDDAYITFLREQLRRADGVCYVWVDHNSTLSGFCGVVSQHSFHPPSVPIMYEWGWYGTPKVAVKCWRACARWAKQRGIKWACRSTGALGKYSDRVYESVTWEKL